MPTQTGLGRLGDGWPCQRLRIKKVKAEADKVGIPMDEREFHCKGEFKGIHKGKPDAEDMKAAMEFAGKVIG